MEILLVVLAVIGAVALALAGLACVFFRDLARLESEDWHGLEEVMTCGARLPTISPPVQTTRGEAAGVVRFRAR